jgi:hypothetical protein
MPHAEYTKLPIPSGAHLEPCPVCGSQAELLQHSESETAPTRKVVWCSNYDGFGPQDREVYEGCLLFMPPHEFYKATIHEAVQYWNEYALALTALRHERMRDGIPSAHD